MKSYLVSTILILSTFNGICAQCGSKKSEEVREILPSSAISNLINYVSEIHKYDQTYYQPRPPPQTQYPPQRPPNRPQNSQPQRPPNRPQNSQPQRPPNRPSKPQRPPNRPQNTQPQRPPNRPQRPTPSIPQFPAATQSPSPNYPPTQRPSITNDEYPPSQEAQYPPNQNFQCQDNLWCNSLRFEDCLQADNEYLWTKCPKLCNTCNCEDISPQCYKDTPNYCHLSNVRYSCRRSCGLCYNN